jgi:arylsulfatase A-like enzyme
MRISIRSTSVVVAALVAIGAWSGVDPGAPRQAAAAAAPDPRPNIIAITTDDMRVSDLEAMPNVRSLLAQQGTTFARSYASFPLCCPSRASFLTGQYAHNHDVLDNAAPLGGYAAFDPSSTYATWLKAAGYQTAFVGKFMNEYASVKPVTKPPGWDDWHASISGGHYFDSLLLENGVKNRYTGPYQTDLYGDIAVDIIEARIPRDAPLFLWASQYAPHVGAPTEPDDPAIATPAVAPRHRNAFSGRPLPTSDPAFNEADVSDKPSYVRSKKRLTTTMQGYMRESYQQRLESLLAVDESVGEIMQALTASGELANTVVLFTSDNGWMMGEHRIHAGKTVVYEPSTRVPLIVRGPGFPAGTTRQQLVANIDLAPTFADIANATPTLTVDGISLLPLATSPTAGATRDLVLEAGPRSSTGPWFYTAVRTPDWLYVEYHETGERELYDMRADPSQLVNLASNSAYAATRRSLADRLAVLRTCAGSTCR